MSFEKKINMKKDDQILTSMPSIFKNKSTKKILKTRKKTRKKK